MSEASTAPRRQRQYQGIFSSSLCGMFENTRQSKTDACALACCGVWLWERNRYLLERKYPRPWRRRPIEMGIVLLTIAAAVVWTLDPENLFLQVAAILIISGLLWKMLEFQHTKSFFRQKLALDRYARERPNPEEALDLYHDPNLHTYLGQHRGEIHGKHALCACARVDRTPQNDDVDDEPNDFCRSLWRFLSRLCCGSCCKCWCQFCGICAIAQEHRHLRQVLPPTPELWQRDYITLQPWNEYFVDILRLRVDRDMRFRAHVTALSVLSSRLIKAVACFLLAAVVVTALPVHYSRWQLVVLLGTFLQPILILYFVHWFWNRLDISIDALIKFFASGFFICTSIAILYEVLVSMVASIALFVVGGFGSLILLLTGEIQIDLAGDNPDDDGDSETFSNPNVRTAYVISIALLGAFLNAFLVAALVEEIGKYLCFWMVEHPDLEDDVVLDNEANSSTSRPTKEERELLPQDDPTETKAPMTRPAVTLTSRGAAITIAMVTTALGFACAENLLYVFVYTQPGIAAEISTLLVRCMLPVHPLAAALQSIGVCRRDLERDPSTQVGRIIFPAWLLHGLFDFTLMSYTVVTQVLEKQNSSAADDEVAEGGTEDDDSVDPIEDLESSMVVLCVVFSIPLLGIVYYFKEAWKQRKRLKELDSRKEHIGVLVS